MRLWPLKIVVKLLLCWVPHRHKILRRLGLFKHGKMDEAAHALKIFNLHAQGAYPDGLPPSFTALELGPGDSLLCALIAKAHGAGEVFLVDVGAYASQDITLYKAAALELKTQHGLNVPDISTVQTAKDVLALCDAHYLTHGLESLKTIPDRSVDFIWSHSVVEHIRKEEFSAVMQELARILKKDGIISHNVDLQDHLDKSLNNLRFPEFLWENNFFANAGFYTNRLRYSQSIELMRKAGFVIKASETGRWDFVPLPRAKMSKNFRDLSEDDLRIRTYSVLLQVV